MTRSDALEIASIQTDESVLFQAADDMDGLTAFDADHLAFAADDLVSSERAFSEVTDDRRPIEKR